jgi:hypothetical protein
MKKKIIGLSCLMLFWGGLAMASDKPAQQVRTYMDYSKPIDPVVMVTIPDMDLSYALASTLVEWDRKKQIVSGISSKWEKVGDKTLRFDLRNDLKWSDGSKLTAPQVKKSFESAFKRHPEDVRSLMDLISEIRCPNDATIEFVLKASIAESGFITKLTEPNYGILKISDAGDPVLKVTSGPFVIRSESENEVSLEKNSHWFKQNLEMPSEVIIRRPEKNFDSERALLTDNWANLVETSSMISAESLSAYEKEKFHIWKRFFDKLGAFRLSWKLADESGFGLLQYLQKNINRKALFKGLGGFEPTEQVFPHGYPLHDPNFRCLEANAKIPDLFRKRPVRILLTTARIGAILQKNIESEVERVTGRKPEIISVSLKDLGKAMKSGDYDIYAGTVGMADPDPEGIMSYYFEGDLPVVPKSKEDFISRLDTARKEQVPEKRIAQMRSIVSDAACRGHILPLFHVSTIGIGRPELDFDEIPLSDESVTLSKIRFRKKN